ncbi:Hypothetical protein NTJ_05107 [Nesidiocoris tenuis]|uniref:Uncharacterized protein n=1 Tax=Nesidiocoris tenuis TaxID=355587 RepID=A0ABN7ALK0_9HEMI|nr:Hypothetical protein NTJ_05107 [Nesidiocoris tenuis]
MTSPPEKPVTLDFSDSENECSDGAFVKLKTENLKPRTKTPGRRLLRRMHLKREKMKTPPLRHRTRREYLPERRPAQGDWTTSRRTSMKVIWTATNLLYSRIKPQ